MCHSPFKKTLWPLHHFLYVVICTGSSGARYPGHPASLEGEAAGSTAHICACAIQQCSRHIWRGTPGAEQGGCAGSVCAIHYSATHLRRDQACCDCAAVGPVCRIATHATCRCLSVEGNFVVFSLSSRSVLSIGVESCGRTRRLPWYHSPLLSMLLSKSGCCRHPPASCQRSEGEPSEGEGCISSSRGAACGPSYSRFTLASGCQGRQCRKGADTLCCMLRVALCTLGFGGL